MSVGWWQRGRSLGGPCPRLPRGSGSVLASSVLVLTLQTLTAGPPSQGSCPAEGRGCRQSWPVSRARPAPSTRPASPLVLGQWCPRPLGLAVCRALGSAGGRALQSRGCWAGASGWGPLLTPRAADCPSPPQPPMVTSVPARVQAGLVVFSWVLCRCLSETGGQQLSTDRFMCWWGGWSLLKATWRKRQEATGPYSSGSGSLGVLGSRQVEPLGPSLGCGAGEPEAPPPQAQRPHPCSSFPLALPLALKLRTRGGGGDPSPGERQGWWRGRLRSRAEVGEPGDQGI